MATLVKVVNEKLQNHATGGTIVKVVNETLSRVGAYKSVQVINEGLSIKEGFFERQDYILPIVKVITESIQPTDDSILDLATARPYHKTEEARITETILGILTYIPQIPVRTPGVHGHKSFRRWYECDVCGFSYPQDELTRDRWGRLVCPDDLDDPNNTDLMKANSSNTKQVKAPWPE